MSASVLATGRAFSSQSAREISSRAGCRAGSPRARTHPTEIAARIQPDLRIQIVHALSQLDSCTRGWMGGRACDGMGSTARTGAAAGSELLISEPKTRARRIDLTEIYTAHPVSSSRDQQPETGSSPRPEVLDYRKSTVSIVAMRKPAWDL